LLVPFSGTSGDGLRVLGLAECNAWSLLTQCAVKVDDEGSAPTGCAFGTPAADALQQDRTDDAHRL
jgi:pantoate kinase